MSKFPHWQSRLAHQLGVSGEVVRDLRRAHLVEGEDWEVDHRNRVMLSDVGLARLKGLLGVAEEPVVPPVPAPAPEPASTPAPASVSGSGRWVVYSTWPAVRNETVVLVRRWEEFEARGDYSVVMRVRDNRVFHINGIIEADQVEDQGDGTLAWVGRYPPRRGYYD